MAGLRGEAAARQFPVIFRLSANPAGGSAWIEWPVLRRLLSPTAVPQSFEYSIRSPQATPRLLPASVGVAARGIQCEAIVPGQYLDVLAVLRIGIGVR